MSFRKRKQLITLILTVTAVWYHVYSPDLPICLVNILQAKQGYFFSKLHVVYVDWTCRLEFSIVGHVSRIPLKKQTGIEADPAPVISSSHILSLSIWHQAYVRWIHACVEVTFTNCVRGGWADHWTGHKVLPGAFGRLSLYFVAFAINLYG